MAIKSVQLVTAGDVVPVSFGGPRPFKEVPIGPLLRNADNKLVYDTMVEIVEFFGDSDSKLPSKATVFADRPNEGHATFTGASTVRLADKSLDGVKQFALDFKAKFPKVGATAERHRVAIRFKRKDSWIAGSYFLMTGTLSLTIVLKKTD